MTKSLKHDWDELLRQARIADLPPNDEQLALWKEGKIDLSRDGWAVPYVQALQKAVEGRDELPLIQMLDAGLAVPTFLLPVMADVIRALTQKTATGRPISLTASDDAAIREHFERVMLYPNVTKTRVIDQLAVIFGVDPRSIERSLTRTSLR